MAGSSPETSFDISADFCGGCCSLTYKRLDTASIIESVQSDEAGANAIFIGTTRDTFQDKEVTLLEYQAYSRLAIATMRSIVEAVLKKNQDNPAKRVIRCEVSHRLGVVPVGEPSIVIAVASPHRREAFEACEEVLEEVKAKAQIWKREYYRGEPDEAAQWKANAPG